MYYIVYNKNVQYCIENSQTPLSINADYSPESNGLFIPAGILQGPFFDSASPVARNYGSIGCILGH